MSKKPAKKSASKPAKKTGKKAAAKPAKAAKRVGKPAGRAGGKASSKKAVASGRKPTGGRTGAAASNAVSQRSSALLRFAHKMLADMAAGIPDERACEQLPGAYNHKLWVLGHMAHSNQWFASLVDGQPMTSPQEWETLYGMKSRPVSDPAVYPPVADMRAAFEASIDRLCAAVDALSDAELDAPPAGDGAGFVSDKLDSALKAVWHYGWHLGQVASLRKGLGLPSLMGG